MNFYWEALISVFLIFWAAEDVRTGRVGWPMMVLLGIAGGAFRVLTGQADLSGVFSGLLPGLFLLPLSCAGGRYIGGGDALGFLVCGTYIGFAGTFELMLLSFTMAGMWGVFLLKIRRKSRNSGFPFFPFVLAAQGMRLLLTFSRNM